MAQAQANTSNANTNHNTNGNNGAGAEAPKGKAAKPPTAIEALGKINKILEQLSAADQKRVLAFLNESAGTGE